MSEIQRPFLKWVGGKTQIIKNIIYKIPNEMNNYHELFLGGGSILFAILSLQKQNKIIIKNKIYAYDINLPLINVYKHIQNNKDELYKFINLYINEYESIEKFTIFESLEYQELKNTIDEVNTKKYIKKLTALDNTLKNRYKELNSCELLKFKENTKNIEEYKKKYDNLNIVEITKKFNEYKQTKKNMEKKFRNPKTIEEAKTSKESYYYWIRNNYNIIDKNSIECSGLFMFINKTCFRGMYREGPNGYNIPYGHYKKTPKIISEADINYISNLIKNVEFKHCSFTESIKNVKENDFVYLDPPYAPENDNSFVGYVSDGFNLETHKLLFREIKKLDKIKFVMSNSKVKLVTDNFKDYNCEDIIARRAINAKNPEATTTEVIIYN